MFMILALTACSAPSGTAASRTPSTEAVPVPTWTASPGPDGARFPTRVSDEGTYFIDQAGEPWFGRGDTAWSLIGQLGPEDVDRYLDDRAARGFNLVLTNVLEHYFSDNAPNNYHDDPPFTGEAFSSAPNEAYWRHVDYVVEAARLRGITLLLCPAYLGFDADEGWSEEVAAATDDDLAAFGAFLGDRYGEFPNIMWLIGHDRVPDDPEKARMEALAAELPADDLLGVGATRDDVLGSPPWSPTAISPDFETVYSFGDTPVADTARTWDMSPALPVMFLEGQYEQEHGAQPGDALLRQQEYGALAAGAAAVLFGNNPIWHFESVPLYDFEGSWRENLASLGSGDAQRLGELVRALPWWEMAPDKTADLLVDADSGANLAARFSRSHALVYVPAEQSVRLNLERLTAAERVDLRRFDPRSGDLELVDTYPTEGVVTVEPPGPNAAGDDDWVYVLAPAG